MNMRLLNLLEDAIGELIGFHTVDNPEKDFEDAIGRFKVAAKNSKQKRKNEKSKEKQYKKLLEAVCDLAYCQAFITSEEKTRDILQSKISEEEMEDFTKVADAHPEHILSYVVHRLCVDTIKYPWNKK